jgi:predicted RND superfamily exporter protein
MTPVIDEAISVYIRRFIGRYYLRIVAASLVVTALASWLLVTQWNINSDFKALLPQDSEAAEAMRQVGDRVGSGSALFVVVDSKNMSANKEFARDFVERLRQMDEVSLAHFHNKLSFFENRQLLYLKNSDLVKIRKRLKDKIRAEKQQANPLFAGLDTDEDENEDGEFIKLDDIRDDYRGLEYRNHQEYMISEDGFSLTIIVRFSRSSTDLAATNELIQRVKDVGKDLDPDSYFKGMDLEYGGGLINRQEDYESIATDIRNSAIFTLVGLFLVISLYFRRKRATALVMVPLVMAVIWTLAIAFMIFDELTTVSAFIFAILLGLGIDYSIHLLSGYDHARLEGKNPLDALALCYQGVGSATVIGALTTFATFVVLSFAQFRGLSQFGQVASIGVLMTVFAMVSVMPALLMTFNYFSPRDESFWTKHSSAAVDPVGSRDTMSKFVPVSIGLVVIFTGLSITQFNDIRFEENFRKLGEIHWPWSRVDRQLERAREDTRGVASDLADHVRNTAVDVRKQAADDYKPRREQETTEEKYKSAMRGQRSSTPTLLLFDDTDEVRRVFNYMRERKQNGGLDNVLSISSIYAFMPGTLETQRKRMKEIEKIEQLLESEDLSILDEDAQQRAKEFQKKLDVQPFTIRDLPIWVKKLFKEAGPAAKDPAPGEPFAYEYVIYVSEGIDQMRGVKAREYLRQLNTVKKEFDEVDFEIGSQSYIYVSMLDEIKEDGPRMIGIALVCVFLILSLAFRSPLRGLVALLPLIFGAIWMFGLISYIGLWLDFFNVVIIPVVIGIGVDAGVHFYRRYLERGEGSGPIVLRLVGSAVAMASITSMVGFGGLAITEDPGLRSIGYLAIAGISTTLVATLVVMPTIFWLTERYQIDWLLPRPSDKPSGRDPS